MERRVSSPGWEIVPRFEIRVWRWKTWVVNIQKLGFEDAAGVTGETKVLICTSGNKTVVPKS